MTATQDASVAEKGKNIDFTLDLNEKLGGSMENGFDALGKVFGGLVGAIKEAIGPELMKSIGAATWLGQVAQCLETLSKSLSTDGTVPDEPAGQLSFLLNQLDASLDGTKLEAQKGAFQQHLQSCQQALANAAADPRAAAKTLAHAVGYFKAAATSMVPIQSRGDASGGE